MIRPQKFGLNGEMVYLWRAVDHEGEVLKSYITKTRDKAAALTFMKKALKRHGPVEKITTDGLRSYKSAMTELGCADKQEIGRWADNRVEKPPAIPTTGAGDTAVSADEELTEVRIGPRQHPQPFQSGTTSLDRQTYKERRSAALAEWQSLAS